MLLTILISTAVVFAIFYFANKREKTKQKEVEVPKQEPVIEHIPIVSIKSVEPVQEELPKEVVEEKPVVKKQSSKKPSAKKKSNKKNTDK